MSVPNQTPYIIYNANGLTTVFPFEFYIINAGDMQVTINGGVITSGFTLSGVGNIGGGDVIFITPPASGSVVMLERVVPTYRLTDYQDNGDLLADTVNKDFDRLWMAIQRSFIYLGRTLRVPEFNVSLLPNVAGRANKILAFNTQGDPIAVPPESGSASDVFIELSKPDGGTHITIGAKTLDELLPIRISDPRWNINSRNTPQVNALNLNALIDYAISQNRLNIVVDANATIDDITVPVRKKTEVFFTKDGGELAGLYRRDAIPVGAPSNVRIENGLVVDGMAAFYRAKTPNVVIMGDSISTDGPDALSKSDSMASIISAAIAKQNPNRTINFLNRAIGGQTWLNANTKPTAFPAWYQDTSKEWLEYVKADSPDLLILAFGMNDANGFNAGALHAVVDKIKAWSKVPSLIFVTNPVPAIATTWSGGSGFYATIFQEGRDWAAGYARSYAKHYGYSVLDMNRQFCLIRDGRDYLSVPLRRGGFFYQSYIHDTSLIARDFTLSGDIAAWPDGKVLSVKVGAGDLDTVFIVNQGGNFKVTALCQGQIYTPYVDITTSVPVVVGQTLDVSVQNNVFTLFSGITRVLSFNLIRTGGELALVAEWQDAPGSGPFVSVTANVGNYLECQYTARDSDIWGHDDGTASIKLPEGGNGINHYSSKGLDLIVRPVVEAFDFSKKSIESSVEISSFNTNVTALTPIFAVRVGNQVSLSGNIKCSSSASYKLFDLPVGYRPTIQRIVQTGSLGSGSWEVCILAIGADGGVTLSAGSATTLITLDSVSFEV
ncbi:hypothetical protein FKC82_00365 [Enterobacter hormaechei]|uniref:GDSL-type esterase/lipase family protein n=1 Tax=Enterobacter hormaechei TaxID=158836 RepID=UPI001144EC60|nr:GDSL-type esterase/lipase family protein [Enterobacter hormaechei]TQD17706.1 hypothetical protein FKC82_00365 [Enterobacter hormaechei]